MDAKHAVISLGALAHASRLAVFRLLVQAGPEGLPATRIAETLDIPPSSLSFHLKELAHAALVTQTREGRSLIYAADFEAMSSLLAFLTKNCCGGHPCVPVCAPVCTDAGAVL